MKLYDKDKVEKNSFVKIQGAVEVEIGKKKKNTLQALKSFYPKQKLDFKKNCQTNAIFFFSKTTF